MSRSVDRITGGVLGLLALVSGGIVLLILWHLVSGAWPAIEAGRLGAFFADEKWQPGSQRDPQFGVMPMLAGSVLVTLLAVAPCPWDLPRPSSTASMLLLRWSDGTGG